MAQPQAETRLEDYRPYPFRIRAVDMDFRLDPDATRVRARLDVERVEDGAPLVLNGEALTLVAVRVDGAALPPERMAVDETSLTIDGLGARATVEIETTCAPAANTALSGLYLSNGMFCTQCEAEGFRRITYYPDRPDVLSVFTVRVEADPARYPVLLANGDRIDAGDTDDGRRYAVWRDPHPKPAYLFALVGGDLACVEDAFVTRSGRTVTLQVYVQHENKDKCAYTLDALKRAMRWDEETFGREYDLDVFMIVAVDHFNFGAMENKGLNIFNSAYVLASPETATDYDYETIEAIVAHEYFHNWSGNRVTCRDWFQLCLKEGFTVFRDQEFSADMRSRPVQRIKDVRRLRAMQFPEDAGPLAHPPRPDRFVTIDNFYTATVYEKGAEIARMLKTLLGPADFRKASDLYFERHDGEAATVEDFVAAMAEASGRDFDQFFRWYVSPGRPTVTIARDGDGFVLHQETPPPASATGKDAAVADGPRHMPVVYRAYDGATGERRGEGVFELRETTARLPIDPAGAGPLILSAFDGFSAPVTVRQDRTLDERLFLARRNADPFNRWDVVQGLWRDLALDVGFDGADARAAAQSGFIEALADALADDALEPAFVAELLKAPTAAELMQDVDAADPDAIVAGRAALRRAVGGALAEPLAAVRERLKLNGPYAPDAEQAGARALRNAALALLVAADDDAPAVAQARMADNMTDEAAAVAALAGSTRPARADALAAFYEKWKGEPLVVNKWLGWRALSPAPDALEDVRGLLAHEAFDLGNPNKVRALIGVFARENVAAFHRVDGAGHTFLADRILEIDARNPQLAARLVSTLESWRKLAGPRRDSAQRALTRLVGAPDASKNLLEMADRILS
ncbi:MAG: aminopeptidase N [Pseudomonadota bacterium]